MNPSPSFCSLRCLSLLAAVRSLRSAGVERCDTVSVFADRISIVVRCDGVDVVRLSVRDNIDVILAENDRLIPALATLFGGMVQAKTTSLSVSSGRRYTATIIGASDDDRHQYVRRDGLHTAASICDVAGFGRSDIILYDPGDVAIVFRSSNTPGSIVVASYVEPAFKPGADASMSGVHQRAVDTRIAIEQVVGNILASNADFRRLALERCPTFADVAIVEKLVFHDMGETIYALLPGSNVVDVVEGRNVSLIPPVVAVSIDGDDADWAYAAGTGANRSTDDIAVALMPRDAERWRIPGETPTISATSARRTVVDGMQCIVAVATHLPFVELRNGRVYGLGVAPLQDIGACMLTDKNACVLLAPSLDDVRRASPESIERAVSLALAQSPSDIGAALHGYAKSVDVDRIVDAFRVAIDTSGGRR